MSEEIVIYHANCWDGFCAAWIMHKAFKDAEFFPAHYGNAPPDVSGKDVYIVDFSYKRSVMKSICCTAKSVTVLDHHKTAQSELDGLEDECRQQALCVPSITFDMNKSGGRLAWEWLWDKQLGKYAYIFGNGETKTRDNPPSLVRYTEDRDLWKWEIHDSREVTAALRTYPLDFAMWDEFDSEPSKWMSRFASEGIVVMRYEQLLVDQHVAHAREVDMDGHKILAVNATVLFSDIAGTLAEGRPFGAAYFDRDDGKRQWSLRSRDDGVDVSEIARKHGGGGHRNAAGFEESFPHVRSAPMREEANELDHLNTSAKNAASRRESE